MANELLKTIEAAAVLGRGIRRVQQLMKEGVLIEGRFPGSVSLASVMEYKRAIERGDIKRGPKRRNGGLEVTRGRLVRK